MEESTIDNYKLVSQLFNAMMDDVLMDLVLQAHKEVKRVNDTCTVCLTRCGQIHLPLPARAAQSQASRAVSPTSNEHNRSSSATPGTATPTGKDSNIYLECLNCHRQFASTRYAPHLSGCLGIGSARRNAARANNAKPNVDRRSLSPSRDDLSSLTSVENKAAVRGKLKKAALINTVSRSREGSPLPKSKRQKSDSVETLGSKLPSRLRDSSLGSLFLGSPSSPSSTSSHSPPSPHARLDSPSPSVARSTPSPAAHGTDQALKFDDLRSSPSLVEKAQPSSTAAIRQRANTSGVDYILGKSFSPTDAISRLNMLEEVDYDSDDSSSSNGS